jgi:hypothetical protein
MEETRSARDVLRVLAPTHWSQSDFEHAAAKFEVFSGGACWRSKYAPFSFLHDDSVAQAA